MINMKSSLSIIYKKKNQDSELKWIDRICEKHHVIRVNSYRIRSVDNKFEGIYAEITNN